MTPLAIIMILLSFLGFTLLQVGCSQPKNTSSIIINNVLSLALSVLMFWATGYAFGFGTSSNAFLSHSRFFLIDVTTSSEFNNWFYQLSLMAIFIAIVNGGFVERMRYKIYCLIAILLSGFFYPVGAHWGWHSNGWLAKGVTNSDSKKITFEDYGGAGVVHLSAGSVALVAAIMLRARVNRLDGTKLKKHLGGETNTNIFLGAFLVIIGLTAKNVTAYTDVTKQSLAAINSILAAFSSAIVAFALKRTGFCGFNWNTKTLLNSAIMGLVAVSGNPGDYHSYSGFAIGFVSGCVFIIWSSLFEACKLDDVSDTITVHLGGGLFGVLAVAMFSKTNGVFYHGEVEYFHKFGWQLLACVVYFSWHAFAVFLTTIGFFCCKKLTYSAGQGRLYSRAHITGLDVHEHDEPAYPEKETYPNLELQGDNLFRDPSSKFLKASEPYTIYQGKAFENVAYGETRN